MIFSPQRIGSPSPTQVLLSCRNAFAFSLRFTVAVALFTASVFQLSAETDIKTLSDNEVAKRQSAAKESSAFLMKAKRAWQDAEFDKKSLETAYNHYLAALELLPKNAATSNQRKEVVDDFCRLAMEYANHLITRGQFQDAESVAKTIRSPSCNPNYKPAAQLLSNLEQPGYYNRTITPAFADRKDKITVILNQAEGYLNTSRYDLALKRYEEALNLDPYNTAARQGMETVNKKRTNYYDEAYNETRSRMLWFTERTWERPIRRLGSFDRSTEAGKLEISTNKDAINRKLNGTLIEKIELPDATLREAVDFLKQKSRDLDTSTDDPKKRGVNIVLKLP